mmetsp:Transcript_20716/g.45498  ORF Transcript_20716/g.45498 Transcript_20716/m.45498 type:complete len:431 (-) Transcript_20716:31-1323(-)|eukprot:CAMPEP_0170616384 /NCGR_PEP_ID=MMETSP0224-20130122/25842_1 /TAXON_ID=285029 /ORGANISM="Togula jolla, Strain CCCM 725" /LENGTH=430 /DNA_ID=CAMNT_0010942179 /DNA_START=98 /DNA_END=1390 /DNA_ORIENTATION=-
MEDAGEVPDEATPLLFWLWDGHLKTPAEFQPQIEKGGFFCVHAPQEPCDDQGRPPPPQLLRYAARPSSSILALLQIRGTIFASLSIWVHVLGNIAVALLVCTVFFWSCQRPELVELSRLSELVTYSSTLVGFLLMMHLLISVRRWWEMRLQTIGGLRSAVSDLAMILAVQFPGRGSSELKALFVRYCLASLELTFMQAQGCDGVLGGLVRQKLLTDDEKRKLEELVSKPQAVWVWIAGIFQQLAERGKLSSLLLVSVYGICARARSTVGRGQGVFKYLDTQLPFSYVHLLSALVHLNNVAIAAKCGALAAVAARNFTRPEAHGPMSRAENVHVLLLQAVFVVGAPALYHGILEEGARLSEPLKDRFLDFPRRSLHISMRRDCEAFFKAGESPPEEALQVTSDFEVQPDDFSQVLSSPPRQPVGRDPEIPV